MVLTAILAMPFNILLNMKKNLTENPLSSSWAWVHSAARCLDVLLPTYSSLPFTAPRVCPPRMHKALPLSRPPARVEGALAWHLFAFVVFISPSLPYLYSSVVLSRTDWTALTLRKFNIVPFRNSRFPREEITHILHYRLHLQLAGQGRGSDSVILEQPLCIPPWIWKQMIASAGVIKIEFHSLAFVPHVPAMLVSLTPALRPAGRQGARGGAPSQMQLLSSWVMDHFFAFVPSCGCRQSLDTKRKETFISVWNLRPVGPSFFF